MLHGDYVRIEVRDEGGPWNERPGADGRVHGLGIVRALATESATDGDAVAGWIAWARLDWPGRTAAAESGTVEPSIPRYAM